MSKPPDVLRRRIFLSLYLLVLAGCILTGLKVLLLHQEQDQGEAVYAQLRLERRVQTDADNGRPATSPKWEVSPRAPERQYPEEVLALQAMQAECSELVAWVRIPDTPVDYPVMQGDDNRKYLDHMPDGTKNTVGSIFLDARTAPRAQHVLLYGHNVGRGTMFGSLRRYRDRAYYEKHPTVTLVTDDRVDTCSVFSVRSVNAYDSGVYSTVFADSAAFETFLSRCKEESLYEIRVELTPEDRVLTLSTCTGGEKSARFVVHARIDTPDPKR